MKIKLPRSPLASGRLGLAIAALTLSVVVVGAEPAQAMCGFIAPKKPPTQRAARITNKSSKVVIARQGERTVVTMANDIHSESDEFALVIPVPTRITKKDVKVASMEVFDQLAALTAPRVVEVEDPDPCAGRFTGVDDALEAPTAAVAGAKSDGSGKQLRASDYGVKVESFFKVGDYNVVILSAKESSGLIEWLNIFHYDIPDDAEEVLTSYLRQDMKFFVTRVNLKRRKKLGKSAYLRPLQITYKSPKFMLPIRLGMLNADGPQELHLWTITDRGRVEPTNYRTKKAFTNLALPAFAIDELNDIYERAFVHQSALEDNRVIWQEFNGVVMVPNWRQPWAGRPLDLAPLGASWTRATKRTPARQAIVTRLHFRYEQKTFPEDLMLQVTDDQTPHSVVYNTRRPWRPAPGAEVCAAGEHYLSSLPARFEREAKTLAELTGDDRQAIRKRLKLEGPVPDKLPSPPEPPMDPTRELRAICGCSRAEVSNSFWGGGLAAVAIVVLVVIRRRRGRDADT